MAFNDIILVWDPFFVFEMHLNPTGAFIDFFNMFGIMENAKGNSEAFVLKLFVYTILLSMVAIFLKSKHANPFFVNRNQKVVLFGVLFASVLTSVLTMIIYEPFGYDFMRLRVHFTWQESPMYYMVWFDVRDVFIRLCQLLMLLAIATRLFKRSSLTSV